MPSNDYSYLGQVQADGSILLENKNVQYRDEMTGDYKRVKQTIDQKRQLASQGYQSVNSSFISGIKQHENDLLIRFHNASVYIYYGYANHFDSMMKSLSKGQYFNKNIRPTKKYNKIDDFEFTQDASASSNISTTSTSKNETIKKPANELTSLDVSKMSDEELFNALDDKYVEDLVSQLGGKTLRIDERRIDGILYQVIIIDDLLEILRPAISHKTRQKNRPTKSVN